MGILLWFLIGLVAGTLTSTLQRNGFLALMADIVGGLIGALIGDFLMSQLHAGSFGPISDLVVSLLGACFLITLFRFLTSSCFLRHAL